MGRILVTGVTGLFDNEIAMGNFSKPDTLPAAPEGIENGFWLATTYPISLLIKSVY